MLTYFTAVVVNNNKYGEKFRIRYIFCFVNFDYLWPSVLYEDRKVTQQHTKDIVLNNVK